MPSSHVGAIAGAANASREMREYYTSRAAYYDDVYLKPERREDIAFLRAHLPARLAGRCVLEVACGTGYWTQHLVRTAAQVTATDLTAEPLTIARERPGAKRVVFVQADAYALPATLGMFDGVFAGLWFSHVPIERREVFLEGLHARLLPGARVVFIDNNEVQLRDFPIAETDAAGNTYQHRTLKDGVTHRVLKNFPSRDELAGLLAPFATRFAYRALENFWFCEYDLR